MLAVAFMFVGPAAMAWLTDILNLQPFLITLWAWLRYPMLISMLLVFSAHAYSLLPAGMSFRLITPGSIAAIAMWLAASLAFRFYVTNFSRYNVVYGSVGAVIVLLLFLYISALALLLGGELNAVLLRRQDAPQNVDDAE